MNNNEEEESCPLKKIKFMKDVNDDDMSVLSSSGEALQVNERENAFTIL